MSKLSDTSPASTARAEKLRAIAAIFGETMAARLAAGVASGPAEAADPERLAWQTNRLIRHLRDKTDAALPHLAEPKAPGAMPGRTAPIAGTGKVPALVAGEDLAAEHPAVIAHILRGEAQTVRVAVLRALPGHVSRAVIQRLRTPQGHRAG